MGHNQPISFHKRVGEKITRTILCTFFQDGGGGSSFGTDGFVSVFIASPLLYGHFLVGPNQEVVTADICLSAELVDVEGELALEVGCLVLGNCVLGSKTVEHSYYFYISFFCLCFVSEGAEVADSVTCSLCIVTVAKAAALCLTDTLDS